MTKPFASESLIFLYLTYSSRIYQSHIAYSLFSITQYPINLLVRICKKSLLINVLAYLPWKSIILGLFLISLVLGVGGSEIRLATPLSSEPGYTGRMQLLTLDVVMAFPLLFLFASVVRQFKNKKKRLIFFRLDVIILIFLLFIEASVILSIDPQTSFLSLLKLNRGILAYFVFSRLLLKGRDLTLILYTFISTVILEGVLSSIQFFSGKYLEIPIESIAKITNLASVEIQAGGTPYVKAAGTFPHPNALSAYMVFLLPLILVGVFSKKPMLRVLSFITTFIGITTIFFTLSRWGIAASVFAITTTAILIWKYAKAKIRDNLPLIKLSIISLTILFAVMFSQQVIAKRFLLFSRNDLSLQARMQLIQQSVYIIKEHPLGIGFGAFQSFLLNYDTTDFHLSDYFYSSVHNVYLLITSEAGILAFCILLLLFIETIALYRKTIKKLDREKKIICIGLFASILTIAFHGLWEFRSVNDRLWLIFWINLGLLVNIFSNTRLNNQRYESPPS